MNPSDYVSPDAGSIMRTAHGFDAFVPAPLPPKLLYDYILVSQLSRADAALGQLSGLGIQIPSPHILIAPYMRREAVLSSKIEGTRASLSDVLLDEAGQPSTQADVAEVRNYITAMEYGLQRLPELPLSLRLVREIHGLLMRGVRGEYATPGGFRRSQNWIGPPGSTIESALYVPPPVSEMTDALSRWESFLQVRSGMPELIQCALIHEHFEAIHPFLDGNGRVGRLLIPLFLTERGRLSQPLLYLSAFFEANRSEYYRLLLRVRTHGDWTAWLLFFLAGVEFSASQGALQARELLQLREQLRSTLAGKSRVLLLVDELFINPYITTVRAMQLLGSSRETARQAVGFLVRAGILHEVTGRRWGRMYLARPIMNVLNPGGQA